LKYIGRRREAAQTLCAVMELTFTPTKCNIQSNFINESIWQVAEASTEKEQHTQLLRLRLVQEILEIKCAETGTVISTDTFKEECASTMEELDILVIQPGHNIT
jgi:hypothetical protein